MTNSLKKRTINGVIWSALERFSALGIQMLCSLIVAHLLTPKDFGILGMISVFSALGLVIIDSGFGAALIRRNDATEIDYSSVFYFNLFFAIICYLILYILSPLIAQFYNIASLTPICRITFLILPINALGLIQNTRLVKKIDFKSIAIVSVLSALISGIIGIILAYQLRNVWALVIQNLLMYGLRTLFLWCISQWKPLLAFSITSIKYMWSYSMNLLGFGIISSLTQNIYPLIIGKLYDATQLGYYSQADRLQKLPATSFTEVIQRVCFPVLSEINNDIVRMQQAYRRIIMVTFFIVFPFMMLLIGTADELIILLMGKQWQQSIIYFKILCIVGALYPLHSINLNILNVIGKSKLSFNLEITRKIILITFILIFAHFDIIIFVWMQVIYGVIVLFLNLYYCGKEIKYSVFSQLKDIFPTIFISILSLSLIYPLSKIIPFGTIGIIAIKCVIFVIIYLSINRIFHTESLNYTTPVVFSLIKHSI